MKRFYWVVMAILFFHTSMMAQLLSPQSNLLMKEEIKWYETVVKNGGWHPLWMPYFKLEQGDWSRSVKKLRVRLWMSKDLPFYNVKGDECRFDAKLTEGVRNFQIRHGLKATGIVNDETLHALNISADFRLRQLQNSLLRQQEFHPPMGPFILVNIPSTHLELIDQGSVVLALRTIVGKKTRPTPIVNSMITSTVFQPTWTVPTTVMTEDMPKKLKKTPTYFEDYNVSVYVKDGNGTRKINPHDVNWSKVEPQAMLHYTFVQDPGPKNALGQIKFNFANPYGVYLHDTAYPELFAEEKRFFSSGCIRTQTPERLVQYFFGEHFQKPKERMAVRLVPKPVMIQTVYWTAWADKGGVVHYREDVYSKDATCDEGRLAGCKPVEGWQNLISKKVLQRAVVPQMAKKEVNVEPSSPDEEGDHSIVTRSVIQ